MNGEESPLYTENETNMAKYDQHVASKQTPATKHVVKHTLTKPVRKPSAVASASKDKKSTLLSGKKDAFNEYVVHGKRNDICTCIVDCVYYAYIYIYVVISLLFSNRKHCRTKLQSSRHKVRCTLRTCRSC